MSSYTIKRQETTRTVVKNAATDPIGIYLKGDGAPEVSWLEKGGLAKAAGLTVGDQIMSINGEAVTGHAECTEKLKQAKGEVSVGVRAALGIRLDGGITPEIMQLDAGSAAETSGLLLGDRILSINGESVVDHADATDKMRAASEVVVAILPRQLDVKVQGAK